MKIDNKGWGLNTLLIMIAVIFIFLLIAMFFSIRLNSYLEKQNNDSEKTLIKAIDKTYFVQITNDMTAAAEKYIKDNDITLTDFHRVIDLQILVSNKYMYEVNDYVSNKKCAGYSVAYLNENDIISIKSYLKCDNYVSNNYGEI